jgi:hypothetical protein
MSQHQAPDFHGKVTTAVNNREKGDVPTQFQHFGNRVHDTFCEKLIEPLCTRLIVCI